MPIETNDEVKVWNEKIREAESAIANQSENWEGYYKLFRGITASGEEEKELRADVHVPIVGPIVHTFTARELMAFFGSPQSITVSLAGQGQEDRLRELERRTRKGLHFLWSEPDVFTPLFNAITDKNVLGNVMAKVIPAYDINGKLDTTRIFETEVIDLLNALFDPNANKWDKVEWAGHRKIVTMQYLETHYGKEKDFKKIKDQLSEGYGGLLDTHLPKTYPKGIELIEIWDKVEENVLTFINRKFLIRKLDSFPYPFPFIMGQCFPESNTVWAYGVVNVLMWIQLHADELANLRLDDLVRNVHTRWVVPTHLYGAMLNAGPGDLIESSDMKNLPEALTAQDVTQSLSGEIDLDKQLAYSTMGISPWTQINIPSKRMTTPEVMLTEKGSGRFWTVMKNSESSFWLPWAEQVLSLMIKFAPNNFFEKTSGPINMTDTPEEYKKYGELTPKDLKGLHAQIQAKMAGDVLREEQKMFGIAQFIRIIGSMAPAYMRTGYALKLLGETLDIPGLEKILKSEEEVKAEREELMKELAMRQQMMAQQQGAQSLGYGRNPVFNEGGM